MAKRTITEIFDDLDGTADARTFAFSVDGTDYEIDLSESNQEAFLTAISSYIEKARKVRRSGGSASPKSRGTSEKSRDLTAVRAWARDNGYEVSDRGRIPASILAAYEAAQG